MSDYQSAPWVWETPEFPNFTFDSGVIAPLLRDYDDACGKLYGVHDTLNDTLKVEAQIDIMVSEAISTSAIEGETLNRESVRNSLKRHLGLAYNRQERNEKSEGVVSTLLASREELNHPLSKERLFDWHRYILGDGKSYLHPDLLVGQWRKSPMQIVSGPIGFQNVDYEAPLPDNVPRLMNDFLDWVNSENLSKFGDALQPGVCVGPIKAAIAHLWFEVVHPLDDGNGRVGRAIADLVLAQDKKRPALFSLSHVIENRRKEYYQQLSAASKSIDVTEWVVWFCHQAIEAQHQAKKIVLAVMEKARFWDRVSNFPDNYLNDRQEKVLNALFLHEPTGFEGGMNAKKYMSLTKSSRATATRDLVDLAEKKCLVSIGGGRSTRYQLYLSKYIEES